MREQIEVLYENGVFRPVEPIRDRFQEHQRLTVTIEGSTQAGHWLDDADPAVSLEEVRRVLAKTTRTLGQMVYEEREER